MRAALRRRCGSGGRRSVSPWTRASRSRRSRSERFRDRGLTRTGSCARGTAPSFLPWRQAYTFAVAHGTGGMMSKWITDVRDAGRARIGRLCHRAACAGRAAAGGRRGAAAGGAASRGAAAHRRGGEQHGLAGAPAVRRTGAGGRAPGGGAAEHGAPRRGAGGAGRWRHGRGRGAGRAGAGAGGRPRHCRAAGGRRGGRSGTRARQRRDGDHQPDGGGGAGGSAQRVRTERRGHTRRRGAGRRTPAATPGSACCTPARRTGRAGAGVHGRVRPRGRRVREAAFDPGATNVSAQLGRLRDAGWRRSSFPLGAELQVVLPQVEYFGLAAS
jgi:hypothetical protein